MPELSQLISDRATDLRLVWREAAKADDLAVMHITGHGNAMLRDIAQWLSSGDEQRLGSIVGSPPWTHNEAGADSPTVLLTSLAITLTSELGAETESQVRQMVSSMAVAIDGAMRQRARALEVRASTDSLTGAMNRSAILRKLDEECARARRYGRSLSVVYFDVDGLKQTNEELGHAAGDDLLRRLADVVKRGTRDSDSFGRLGGDEFLLVLPETDSAGTRMMAERLSETAEAKDLRASSGFAGTPDTDIEPKTLIAEADAAMRSMKASKR